MENLDDLFETYINDIMYVYSFIKEHFGVNDVLLRKNKGLISTCDFGIKNSRIKGYAFHGYGCNFRFASHNIDIEFTVDNKIGFTKWSFYTYCNAYIPGISEQEVFLLISSKEMGGKIIVENKICIVNK